MSKLESLLLAALLLGMSSCRSGYNSRNACLHRWPSMPESSLAGASAVATPGCGLPSRLFHPDWPRALSSASNQEHHPAPDGTMTLVLLPDTQYYTACRYPHLSNQAEFVARERATRRILGVIGLGDLTDHNTPEEWEFTRSSLSAIPRDLPLMLTTGNHDVGHSGTTDNRESLLARYFGQSWAAEAGALRETMTQGSVENAFYSLDAGHVRLGVLMLEWSPRRVAVDWANQVLGRYRDHRVMVATHAYVYDDSNRYDHVNRPDQEWSPFDYGTSQGAFADDGNHDGEMLWNALVRRHAGIFLVVSGHVLGQGTGRLASRGDSGNTVHQVLVNYQMLDQGGLGYLRLLEFYPDGRSLHMKTYSPSLRLFSYAADQDFRLEIDPPLWNPGS